MATRFYFPSTGAAAVAVTPSADWSSIVGAQTAKACVTTKISSSMANVANSENNASDYYRVLIQQYVSAPLNGNQTISGTWAMYIMGLESNAAAQFCLFSCARVFSNDGTTLRGTLWAGGDTSSEWNTSIRNSGSNTNDIGSVNALNGDRIVFELGFDSQDQASTTSYTGTIRIGDNGAADQPENETGTDQTLNPWVEFDDVTLSFSAETGATLSISVIQGVTTGEALGQVGGNPLPSATQAVDITEVAPEATVSAPLASVTQSITVSEILTLEGIPNPAVVQAVTVAESKSLEVGSPPVSVTQAVDITDVAPTAAVSAPPVSVTQAVTVAEVITSTGGNPLASVTQTITTGEAVSALPLINTLTATQAVTVVDSVEADTQPICHESASITEYVEVFIVAASGFTVSVSDGVTVGESTTQAVGTMSVSVTQAVTVGEAISAQTLGQFQLSVSQAVTVGESVTTALASLTVSVSETVTVGEIARRLIPFTGAVVGTVPSIWPYCEMCGKPQVFALLNFTGGRFEPVIGETIEGDLSGHTGVVDSVVVTSGAWTPGTAAGYVTLSSPRGGDAVQFTAFTAGETATGSTSGDMAFTISTGYLLVHGKTYREEEIYEWRGKHLCEKHYNMRVMPVAISEQKIDVDDDLWGW